MTRSSLYTSGGGRRFFDLLAVVGALPVAWEIYEKLVGTRWLPPLHSLLPGLVASLVIWGGAAWMHRLYERPMSTTALAEIERPIRAVATLALALTALGYLMRQHSIPRLLVVAYVGTVFVLVVASRLLRSVVLRATVGERFAQRYAIVGTGGLAREVTEAVDAHPEWGMRLAGFVELDGAPERSRGPSLGRLSELGQILEQKVIDIVVFAVPRQRLGEIERAVHVCNQQGVEVRISLDILRFGPGRMELAHMDGVPMLAFTRTPTDPFALALKRVFDVVMSALVLFLLAPALAALAIAIKLDSPGPVLFRQRRVGQNGRIFEMLKFRSMHIDAEQRLEALRAQNEMTGPVFKMKNDPRITRVGAFLRKTSLDEIPQFWNVLVGHMSIVGPRPPIPAEVREYKRWQRRRLSMKPGITCIWQISGRNNIEFERWMELDLQYIDEWSLWGDIEICFKTIPAVLTARGVR